MTYKTNTPPIGGVSCLFSEALGLLANQFRIVEVVDTHCLANLIHRLGTHLARLFRTLLQDIVDLGDVLLELRTTSTHRLQELIEHLIEELLALHVAQTTTTVVILQLVEVLIIRPELLEVIIAGESIGS